MVSSFRRYVLIRQVAINTASKYSLSTDYQIATFFYENTVERSSMVCRFRGRGCAFIDPFSCVCYSKIMSNATPQMELLEADYPPIVRFTDQQR